MTNVFSLCSLDSPLIFVCHHKELIPEAKQVEVLPRQGPLCLYLASLFDAYGPTYIENVKPGSQLEGKVQIGDLIVSIDGVNVTTMPACEIVKLMSSKPDGAETIVFARGKRLYN